MVISKHYQLLSINDDDDNDDDDDDDGSHGDQQSLTLEPCIKFVEPFVDRIHSNCNWDHMIYWTPTQQGCVCL